MIRFLHHPVNRLSVLCVSLATAAPFFGEAETEILSNRNPEPWLEARLDDLLPRLNQEEELRLLSGLNFTTFPIERLGVPAKQWRTYQGNFKVEIRASSRTFARRPDSPSPPTSPSRCRTPKIGRTPWPQASQASRDNQPSRS
jgi:hypothetical protein